jgi:hypothetical protein
MELRKYDMDAIFTQDTDPILHDPPVRALATTGIGGQRAFDGRACINQVSYLNVQRRRCVWSGIAAPSTRELLRGCVDWRSFV